MSPGEAVAFHRIKSATTEHDLRLAYTENTSALTSNQLLRELWSTRGKLLRAEQQRAEAERQADEANRRARGEHIHDDACRLDVAGDIATMRQLQRVRDPGRAATEYLRHREIQTKAAQHLADHPDLATELAKTLSHFESMASAYDAAYRDDDR